MSFPELLRKNWIVLVFLISLIAILIFKSPLLITGTNKKLNKTEHKKNKSINYSTHPEMKECKGIENEIDRSFCIADVAEIRNNVTLCDKIDGKYIKNFCIARITLNKTKCKTLNDEKLIQSCIESIELKQKWKDQE